MRIGAKIEVYWDDDQKFYTAVVREQSRGRTRLEYLDDQTEEWVVLRNERWRAVAEKQPKRRRIVPDDDESESHEEMEFDDIDDDDKDEDASFQDPGADDEDEAEEEDNWIVSDEEEEEEAKKSKKRASLVVRPYKASSTTTSNRTPANKGRRPSLTSMTAPSSSVSSTASSSMSTPSSRTGGASSSYVTPPLSTGGCSPTAFSSSCTVATPLPYEQGAVNPAGSHVHHHLNFLRNPRDAQNRPPTHPDYDGRTLRLQPEEWKKHNNGKAMTEGTKQWWDIKAQYFDTVLLFKTGKFYEMYNMDADVGVQVCGTSMLLLLF